MNTVSDLLNLFDSLTITKEQVIITINGEEYLVGGKLFDKIIKSDKEVYRIPSHSPLIEACDIADIPVPQIMRDYDEYRRDNLGIKIPAFRKSVR